MNRLVNLLSRAVIVLSLVFGMAGSTEAVQHPSSRPMGIVVSTAWLATHLSDDDLVILHVGMDRQSYDGGHIPGARFLALSEITTAQGGIPNQLPSAGALKAAFERVGVGDRSRVVVYGDMFGALAARVFFTLDYLGHGSQSAILDGGLEAWSKEHSAVTAVPRVVGPTILTVHLHPEYTVDLATVKDAAGNKRFALVDARAPADFSGTGLSNGLPRVGHIPGAKNVFWVDTLVSRENPVLKPAAEIRARYAAAGIKTPGAKVIVYCRSGIQAAHAYLTLKVAGFRPVLYTGSFNEWSAAFGTMVETGAPVPPAA